MNIGEGQRNLLFVAIGVVLVLGVLYFKFRPKASAPRVRKSEVSKVQMPEKKTSVEIVEAIKEGPSGGELQKLRQQANIQIEQGLQIVPSSELNDKIGFRAATKVFASGCTNGDFDLIKAIATDFKTKEFLLSVEPLHSKGDGFQVRVNLGDIMNGRGWAIDLPKNSGKARDYGVYLCRDSGNTNRCGTKKALGPRYWAGIYKNKSDNDKILYFSMLTVREGVVYVIPGKNLNEANVSKLKKSLKPILEESDSLDTFRKIFLDLSSVPSRVNRSSLELPLPYKHPKCL